jgi:glycerol-3-phosphate dehydrogenase
VTEQEIQELLEGVNSLYPSLGLSSSDALFVHCGLVPISDVNPRTGNVKRANHYTIRNHKADGIDGLISLVGVKYTTARDVAEKVVDLVFRNRNLNPPNSNSANIPLVGGDIEQFDAFQEVELKKRLCGLDEGVIKEFICNYGTDYPKVLKYMEETKSGLFDSPDDTPLMSQVIYSVRHEMALKLSDVILRRTGIGTIGYPGDAQLQFCASVMREELGWDFARMQREILELKDSFPNQN